MTHGKRDEANMRYIVERSSSPVPHAAADDYQLAMAYFLLAATTRDRVRGAFHRALGHSMTPLACRYVRSLWPKYGDPELVKFIEMLVSGGAVKFQYSVFNCIDKADVRRVVLDVLSVAKRVTTNGHDAFDTMLEALPPSPAKDAVVRQEVEYRLAAIRTSLQRQTPTQAGTEVKNEPTWVRFEDLLPATLRHGSIMALLYEHPVLLQGISWQERRELRKVVLDETQRKVPALSLIDADRLSRALGWQLDGLSEEHLADQLRERLSAGNMKVVDADVQGDDPATDFEDLEHSSCEYTTADVEQAVSSLGPAARSLLAAGLVRDTCRALRSEPVALMMSALAAAVGDRWDTEPWLAVRLELLNLPITVGDPTDVLLGGRPTHSYSGHFQQPWNDRGFWKSLERFRKDHGLRQATLDQVRVDCPSPPNP